MKGPVGAHSPPSYTTVHVLCTYQLFAPLPQLGDRVRLTRGFDKKYAPGVGHLRYLMLSTCNNKVWISKQKESTENGVFGGNVRLVATSSILIKSPRYPQGPGWKFRLQPTYFLKVEHIDYYTDMVKSPPFPQLGWVGHTIDRCITARPYTCSHTSSHHAS